MGDYSIGEMGGIFCAVAGVSLAEGTGFSPVAGSFVAWEGFSAEGSGGIVSVQVMVISGFGSNIVLFVGEMFVCSVKTVIFVAASPKKVEIIGTKNK